MFYDDKGFDENLLYIIEPRFHTKEDLRAILSQHPQIKFVSLAGIDLRGNDTDEKIPIGCFLHDIDEFLSGGVSTDGSSVVLPGIATLNDGQVDLVADLSVNWYIDYNFEHLDAVTGRPVGTLRIPSFLIHNGRRVDSRSILQNCIEFQKKEIMNLLKENPKAVLSAGIDPDDIADIELVAATELEFWVKTPGDKAEIEELSVSQVLKEQYWKRTKGNVRTALEKSLLILERYGLEPEMGHKEVGGVKAQISGDGSLSHIMEQLEIDWKYSNAMQAADNELLARILIKETFRHHGLEVTFMAKPIEGVNGSGEHTHLSIIATLKNGKKVNLFTPADMKKDYLNVIGWGALMGLLKNYEVVNPFIASSNDAINRLKPGFEAPICIVASIGKNVETPSRNRTVLVGLVRDTDNPLSTRFEVRSPNPHTNSFLAIAALYQAMLDGIKYAVRSGKTAQQLQDEFCKKPGEKVDYLETERAYRSEEDVFEYYTEQERNAIFGVPPATVWENLKNFEKYPEKVKVLSEGGVFEKRIIDSYVSAIREQWLMELSERIIHENLMLVKSCMKIHDVDEFNEYDEQLWEKINNLRRYLMKDSLADTSLFTRIRKAIEAADYDTVSSLQQEMTLKVNELRKLYAKYRRNIMNWN